MEDRLTVPEIARRCKVSEQQVRRRLKLLGAVPAGKGRGGAFVYSSADARAVERMIRTEVYHLDDRVVIMLGEMAGIDYALRAIGYDVRPAPTVLGAIARHPVEGQRPLLVAPKQIDDPREVELLLALIKDLDVVLVGGIFEGDPRLVEAARAVCSPEDVRGVALAVQEILGATRLK